MGSLPAISCELGQGSWDDNSFYSNGKLGWAKACGKLGETRQTGLKKNCSGIMERVQTLNLSTAFGDHCLIFLFFSHLK